MIRINMLHHWPHKFIRHAGVLVCLMCQRIWK